jgi:hypothetical protein
LPENWTPPPPEQLRNQDPREGELVPYKVFGFPVLIEDRDHWADRLGIDTGLHPMHRQRESWQKFRQAVRAQFNCPTTAIQLPNSSSMCIIIGSNKTPKDLARAQDMALIRDVHKAIRTRYLPDWFPPLDSRDLASGRKGRRDLKRGVLAKESVDLDVAKVA